ncbi:abortive infection phage resistance protein [Burkholderia pseudomallei]|uniref:AIPR family protein n=1 Tax=Burkholderia pseudomallei TaxID=28450 RepID=UPI000F06A8A2|nr:AIPR family protein [Burkholderia pseudomallei]CAJ3557097.1 abortive infection phage resistance protein [Burkholderia pseudomallei]CAJ3597318.1 abortive infection phage resistance protein [Burkholderia pseudomallei]CAJ3652217.1 abortive infection phage resistance protein [Burkholderia pseudomallei]CAJ3793999.1 abortive infection phage resistance protein [Burkholderia pseudomallei]CAJ3883614.1 abortive infection phage resistance protein [Burkholderia pseudomallei]
MATVLARPLELDLLCQKLDEDYATRITGTGNAPAAQRSNFLSKAIAAFVLHEAAGATLDEAVAASIDGGNDHGIDSVFVATDQTIWLVQSKYKDSGTGEPELGEVSKFRDGITDLLQGRWDRFNDALRNRQAAITNALNSGICKVKVVLAYSGTAVSDDRRDIFADLERAFNGTNPGFVRCHAYGLITLHDLHLDGVSAQPIEAEIELKDFGHTQEPYRAFYGRVDAKRLAEMWAAHKDHLVDRNIRRFKGTTTVNAGLSETLRQEAQHFFYFNNGVTFLCDSIQEQHPRDPHRQIGRFRVRGLSIINGAQTVGAIAREPLAHYDAHPAVVMVTFVSLENAPDGFGDRVTQSRNRQNAVDLEDFAALDERQATWQHTLRMAGITYLVKQGEDDPPPSSTCFSARELAPLLACTVTTNDWQDFVVAAKADRKKLFGREGLVSATDPLRQSYERLFVDSLTARQMWRIVQIGRVVIEQVRARASAESDPAGMPAGTLPAREILNHGVWLVLHVIFIRVPLQNGPTLTLSQDELTAISRAVDLVSEHLVSVVQGVQWNKLARSVFENKTDCRTVKGRLMAALAQQN